MTKVFVGGSRKVSRLSADVRSRIDSIMEKRILVLVGDANGADKAVQQHLHSKGYNLVEVFCTADECRNNLGGWPVRTIPSNGKRRSFSFYAIKDRAMAVQASIGLMIWDGKSIGTLMNMLRLIRQQKKVVVYVAPVKEFVNLRNDTDLEVLVSRCAPDLWQRLERESAAEQKADRITCQANLL